MENLYYYVLSDETGETTCNLDTIQQYYKDTFSPTIKTLVFFRLDRLKGKTYAEKQNNLEEIAIEFSHFEPCNGLSWWEYAKVEGFFEKYGKRYGLLKEFRENRII